ncbi:hypothetical protein JTB14_015853 [Gonioctena quinquepunctata]|nr:hypothetical protein JTB14_015853 [Gonioctena quinquepunctata]
MAKQFNENKIAEKVETVSVSHQTIGVDHINQYVSKKLHDTVEKCKYVALCLEESTDLSDISQLVIFIPIFLEDEVKPNTTELENRMLFTISVRNVSRADLKLELCDLQSDPFYQGRTELYFLELLPEERYLNLRNLGLTLVSMLGSQDYIFSSQANAPFNPFQQNRNHYINPSEIIPYRQSPVSFESLDPPSSFQPSSFLQSSDLQTSDIPAHLQQTLPQYRYTTSSPQILNFQDDNVYNQFPFQNQNSGQRSLGQPPSNYRTPQQQLRPSQRQLRPTTIRPNYSHLFAKTHNRDPSQTETFLGQITLQNPVGDSTRYDDFKSTNAFPEKSGEVSSDGFGETLEDNGGNSIAFGSRPDFLNHRTRIVAPDPSKRTTKPQVKDYFVNSNGEVSPTKRTENPKLDSSSSSSLGQSLAFNFEKNKKNFIPKREKPGDLEPLLEEPLKYDFGTNNDDEVEVIKSPRGGDKREHLGENEYTNFTQRTHENNENVEVDTEEPYDSTEYYSEETDGNHEANEEDENLENDIHGNDYHDEGEEEFEEQEKQLEHLQKSEITSAIPKVDSTSKVISTPSTEAKSKFQNPSVIKKVNFVETTTASSVPSIKDDHELTIGELEDEPELVTSVVTSKTVVNNTVIASATPLPAVTESVRSSTDSTITGHTENTTDTWVVIASVQTSRSVSGARYLPSSIVEQDVRVKLLNEHHIDDYSKEETTTEAETTTLVTSPKPKTSTESLIDKLDRAQSDLSSGFLTGGLENIEVIKENPEKMDMEDIKLTSSTTKAPYPQVNIRKYSPSNRRTTTRRPRPQPKNKKPFDIDQPQGDQPSKKPTDITAFLSTGYKLNASDDKSSKLLEEILSRNKPKKVEESKASKTEETTASVSTEKGIFKNEKIDDISKFLPPGYKLPADGEKTESSIFTNIDDISKFLPPGYKPSISEEQTTQGSILKNTKADDISKFLPPGYKLPKTEEKTTESGIFKNTKADDLSKFLPPGYKLPKSEEKTTESSGSLKNTKADDISKFLPPGYKLPKSEEKTTESSTFIKNTKADDISKFLPPGYKVPKYKSSTESSISKNTKSDDISKFLPPGFKLPMGPSEKTEESDPLQGLKIKPVDLSSFLPPNFKPDSSTPGAADTASPEPSTTKKPAADNGFKVVFASRPGGGHRKSSARTTPKSVGEEPVNRNTPPTIHKGWPSRATTEFTGWPTPSTTPISIEKLLEAARAASSTTARTIETTIPTSTTTTTTTTTTPRPTTPGVCTNECDLAATIKLVGGVSWAPELLDRNTKEWQVLANEVETQLDYVYSTSSLLNKWYKKIRIDGFSEGSVLVDYLVELNDLGRRIDTQEMKKLFHESLDDPLLSLAVSNREGKSLNESWKTEGKLALGNFIVDPKYTDFLVLPKVSYPTVGFAENDVLLPQWAIAVIVIGLASLLFVIIFGVTVLVNRQKNSKKKAPTPLTEDMLNELNKNHMGGLDNYGADDLYNMEDVWNEREYEQKPRKKRSSGSIHDNSMSNLYDSWRSEWNGYYYNAYYGNNPGSSHSGYNGRRRSDYDTNF